MAQTKILLDTNSYLRLAVNLHPLLFVRKTWTTLELMKSMVDAGHIDMTMVRRVVGNWIYDGDLPARKLREPYKDYFGEDPPCRTTIKAVRRRQLKLVTGLAGIRGRERGFF